jgi:dynein heavy chain 2
LLIALRKAVSKHIAEIDKFLDDGLEALSARPTTVAEIGKTNAQHKIISEQMPMKKPLFAAAETKNRLLRATAGTTVDLTQVQQRWDKFELMLESHELMIKEQVDVMKAGVSPGSTSSRRTSSRFHLHGKRSSRRTKISTAARRPLQP